MITWLLSLFGCRHRSTSWPIKMGESAQTTCLDCGRSFTYNWETMERGEAIEPAPYARVRREPSPSVRVVG